ncbi:MAG: ammonia-forming cytochrome c nitrite reductase subunit c552 [Deltaproteobacteria bacterium]|nr:ammonia-forming cytochrome c nitrite reductase subunit c552 [Deltaproteobacteria bacterium]
MTEERNAPAIVWWKRPWVVGFGTLVATVLIGLVIVSIMERRWETTRPQIVVSPVDEWETDNAVWGRNYPREYESFLKTEDSTTQTLYGGSVPRDYLELDPRQVLLFAGYGFSKDYLQGRGHMWAVKDPKDSLRTTRADGTDTGQPGTCWTCKSPQVPALMAEMGVKEFYATPWKDLAPKMEHPIGCLDCHHPLTMELRISRPALKEAMARQGVDADEASHQDMRSLVCAQCHVEYYFGNDPEANVAGEPTFGRKGTWLVFPWDEGTGVDAVEAYFAKRPEYFDWVHPVSGARMIKMQHPDWEVYSTGIHAYRNVACADCHMPYVTEGGVKYTDHHIQSPLLTVSRSCGVCHRWSEKEIVDRVEDTQRKQDALKLRAEDALVLAHLDVAACGEAGATDEELQPLRDRLWRAQLRWDYMGANNGMGFHSPQECMRALGTSIDLAQEVRIEATRLLARRGHTDPLAYPDISTRGKALELIKAFEAAAKDPALRPPTLL